MLPERRPADADIGPGDDGTVDVTANATIGDRKAELPAGAVAGPDIEAGAAQPADAEVFQLVADVEDAQRPGPRTPGRRPSAFA